MQLLVSDSCILQTIEYLSESVYMCLCVCAWSSVCSKKNNSGYVAVYDKSSDTFDIGQCSIKIKDTFFPIYYNEIVRCYNSNIRDGPFDIQGGGWDFFEKNSLFPYRSKKNKMSSTRLKINSLFFIQQIFPKPFFPQSYRGLQITQNLTCIKHIDLLLASSVLNVNYQIRTIHRNICKD